MKGDNYLLLFTAIILLMSPYFVLIIFCFSDIVLNHHPSLNMFLGWAFGLASKLSF